MVDFILLHFHWIFNENQWFLVRMHALCASFKRPRPPLWSCGGLTLRMRVLILHWKLQWKMKDLKNRDTKYNRNEKMTAAVLLSISKPCLMSFCFVFIEFSMKIRGFYYVCTLLARPQSLCASFKRAPAPPCGLVVAWFCEIVGFHYTFAFYCAGMIHFH